MAGKSGRKKKSLAVDAAGESNTACQQSNTEGPSAPTPETKTGATPETRKTEAVSKRLVDLEQAMGVVSSAIDLFESLLGLCERMATKSRQAASVGERFAVWSPLTLLHSAASMSQRDIIGELDKMSNELARMGAEYRLLKSEQRDAAVIEAEREDEHDSD